MVAVRVLCLLVVGAAALQVKTPFDPLIFDPLHLMDGQPWARQLKVQTVAATSNPKNPVATLKTTMGDIEVELFLDKSPVTVSNFIDLAKTGFYNGLHFHRVIPNFMDQFGCPHSKDPTSSLAGTGGPSPNTKFVNLATKEVMARSSAGKIPDECPQLSNEAGTLAMANSGPQSGGSQFFMNVKDNKFLDCFDHSTRSNHPVFGRITSGYDLAVKISEVQTQHDKPVTPIKMISVDVKGEKNL